MAFDNGGIVVESRTFKFMEKGLPFWKAGLFLCVILTTAKTVLGLL